MQIKLYFWVIKILKCNSIIFNFCRLYQTKLFTLAFALCMSMSKLQPHTSTYALPSLSGEKEFSDTHLCPVVVRLRQWLRPCFSTDSQKSQVTLLAVYRRAEFKPLLNNTAVIKIAVLMLVSSRKSFVYTIRIIICGVSVPLCTFVTDS